MPLTDLQRARRMAAKGGWADWVRNEADAVAVLKHGCVFDQGRANRVLNFCRLVRHSKGKWAGEVFDPLPWQWEDVLAPLYGWTRPDGTRRYRRAYIEIPKKNGKSTMCAVLSLYHLFGDKEPGAEVYNAAADRTQAGIVFREALAMLEKSPQLLREIDPRRDIVRSTKTISYPATASLYRALSADVPTKEGMNISALVFDELHAQKKRDLWNTLVYGGAAREQPMMIAITTAGIHDETTIGWEQHEYARQVLSGLLEDFSQFAYIRNVEADADWTDPKMWERANPSWEKTIRPEEMEEACRAAQASVADQNNFRRYRLNQWVQQTTRVIDMAEWKQNVGHEIDEAEYAGRHCYGGLDLSAISDLSAWALLFPCEHDPEALDVIVRCWVPEATLVDPKNLNRHLYQQWVENGLLDPTPGNVIDYAAIRERVFRDAETFDIRETNVDKRFQGQQLVNEMVDAGMEVFPMGQGFNAWAVPMKEFLRLVKAGKFHHGGHPILEWAADNLEAKPGQQGDLMPIKPQNRRKIDPIVAAMMALDRSTRHAADEDESASVYDTRGLEWVEV